jgi:hypothetical protein
MRFRILSILILSAALFQGCTKGPDAGLLSYSKVIKTETINTELLKVTPISRRSTFGSFRIIRAEIQPTTQDDRVMLVTPFALTTFEIPEGNEGTLTSSCGLRYDPQSKQIFLTDIRPGAMRFNNASLAEYVSKGAKKGIGSGVAKVFGDIPIYQLEKSFGAKFIKKVGVHKGNIVLGYGV